MPLPTSDHYQLECVADGVYAAVASKGGLAIRNAGIIDLGDQTIILDTFKDPRCAADLQSTAEELTGRPVSYVINTHMHADHSYGNQVFTADICFFGSQPYMGDGRLKNWRMQLGRLAGSDSELFIQRHGPAGDKTDIRRLQDYFGWLEGRISDAIREAEPREVVLKTPIPPPFDDWSTGGLPSEVNVKKMFRILGRKRGKKAHSSQSADQPNAQISSAKPCRCKPGGCGPSLPHIRRNSRWRSPESCAHRVNPCDHQYPNRFRSSAAAALLNGIFVPS